MRYVFLLVLIIQIMGCSSSQMQSSDYSQISGKWLAEGSKKGIEVNDKGEIISIINEGGMKIDVAAGGAHQTDPQNDVTLTVVLGETNLSYNEKSSFMKATIVFDEYLITGPDFEISGTMKEVIEGSLNDTKNIWNAKVCNEGTIAGRPDASGKTEVEIIFKKQ